MQIGSIRATRSPEAEAGEKEPSETLQRIHPRSGRTSRSDRKLKPETTATAADSTRPVEYCHPAPEPQFFTSLERNREVTRTHRRWKVWHHLAKLRWG